MCINWAENITIRSLLVLGWIILTKSCYRLTLVRCLIVFLYLSKIYGSETECQNKSDTLAPIKVTAMAFRTELRIKHLDKQMTNEITKKTEQFPSRD